MRLTLAGLLIFPSVFISVHLWFLPVSYGASQAQSAFLNHSTIIDACQYSDAAAAQAAWEPMTGTTPANIATLQGKKALSLHCNFAGNKIERASWDRKINLDLTSCRGLQFKLFCSDPSPVSYFSIYFQSGAGWYHATFFPESTTDWNTITIDKANTRTEGKPAGWGQIRTIRISAWRARDTNTTFYLSDLRKTGVLGVDAQVAVLRAESAAQRSPDEARSVQQYSENVAKNLEAAGIGSSIISDLDATSELLAKTKLVILPYNPQLPDRVANALVEYAKRGGKLMAFYIVPEKLQSVFQVQQGKHVKAPYPGAFASIHFPANTLSGAPAVVGQHSWNINALQAIPGASRVLAEWFDDQGKSTGYPAVLGSSNGLIVTHVLLADDLPNKQRMLLALAGHLVPELWQHAVQASLDRLGKISTFQNFDQAFEQITLGNLKNPRVSEKIFGAQKLRSAALDLVSRKQYAEALDHAAAAQQAVLESFCLAQKPLPGEFRAFWCHSAFGVDGIEWEEAIARLASNGFTAIVPNMLWGGAAYYDSKVLPKPAQARTNTDQIARCLAACRKHGIQIHVWKVNWNLGSAAPKEFVQLLRRQKRLQTSSRGAEELWLCPSHPENQKLEISSMLEVARNYDVDGLHFDYIRYPDSDHCFCDGCKERFQRATSLTVTNWPADLLKDAPLRQSWLDWRRANITTVVKTVSEQARLLKPRIKISAAVFQNWPAHRDSVGQDWKLWCDKGYVDFVCPMDYTPSHRSFEGLVSQQVQWAGKIPCYPGIGVSASSSKFGPDEVIEQINITRRYNTKGFIIFNYGASESRDLLPLLGLGITRK